MKLKNARTISVHKSVKPIHLSLRTAPKLIVSDTYYISFGMNEAIPCMLIEILDNNQIRVGLKNNSTLGYGDVHTIASNEIGTSPEEAVINEQTF
ncbi:MAG TPA: hypothetical protein VK718_00400 [Ferruginibacter sp.]|jgi:hypothetical protein|nr:hypothetical protein [Ferruginibacter sp.]